ncbi:f-box-like domain-containing protein [Ditylenchus destructor]|nr:f-box-like domain-containing protein [Ditylenchus destructor]
MDGGTNINELPDVILAKIFEELWRKERLQVEQVCKKWHYVGRNLVSYSDYKYFDNQKCRDWPAERVTEKRKGLSTNSPTAYCPTVQILRPPILRPVNSPTGQLSDRSILRPVNCPTGYFSDR